MKQRLSQFLDQIKDPEEFIRVWQANRDKKSRAEMGFAQFNGAITIVEVLVPMSTVGIPSTPLFQNEELEDSLPLMHRSAKCSNHWKFV